MYMYMSVLKIALLFTSETCETFPMECLCNWTKCQWRYHTDMCMYPCQFEGKVPVWLHPNKLLDVIISVRQTNKGTQTDTPHQKVKIKQTDRQTLSLCSLCKSDDFSHTHTPHQNIYHHHLGGRGGGRGGHRAAPRALQHPPPAENPRWLFNLKLAPAREAQRENKVL